jgi:hypothetical protein
LDLEAHPHGPAADGTVLHVLLGAGGAIDDEFDSLATVGTKDLGASHGIGKHGLSSSFRSVSLAFRSPFTSPMSTQKRCTPSMALLSIRPCSSPAPMKSCVALPKRARRDRAKPVRRAAMHALSDA